MRKYLRFIILLALAVLLLWWFGRGLDWPGVRAAIAGADKLLIAGAIGIICLSYLIRAFRWQALLKPLCPASLSALFAATTVGFGALFLVGRAGEVLRPAFLPLRDRRVNPGAAFITIGIERIYDLTAVVMLFAANLLWFRPPAADPGIYSRVRMAGLVMLGGAALGITALVLFERHAPQVIGWVGVYAERSPAFLRRLGRVFTNLLGQLARALGVLVDFRELAVTIGWTALLWGGGMAANWMVLRAFGLSFGPGEAIFLMGWSLVGSLVPTPGGAAGAFHAATGAGLIFLGVGHEQAAAVSIVIHLVMFAPAVIFGLYYFLRSGASFAELRRLVSSGVPASDERGATPEKLPTSGVQA
ncbi:MAG TPA: lysylphosphatidylglycerol synthase transmembrane domain-containing protein [Pyrinomonadaceae bacterium]|nr:lysylphosphatidylglycerol synthase transmembrane domain-containing protein [Pyrinomonadaceae bacterium]